MNSRQRRVYTRKLKAEWPLGTRVVVTEGRRTGIEGAVIDVKPWGTWKIRVHYDVGVPDWRGNLVFASDHHATGLRKL